MELNFTLASVLIIVYLYIPGYFFKRFYFLGKFTHQFSSGIFAERFITSIFWGCVIQAITLFFYGRFFGFDYDLVKPFLIRCFDELNKSKLPDVTSRDLLKFTFYECLALLIAMFVGVSTHKIVRIVGLDVRFPVMRFNNSWHYTFKGDLIKHLTPSGEKGKVQFTEIDCLTYDGKNSTLYSGLLSDYTLNSKGDLESLTLKTPSRYKKSVQAFISIPGDCLVIPEKGITNINIRYSVVPKMTTKEKIENVFSVLVLISLLGILFIIPYQFSYLKWGLLVPMVTLIISLFFLIAAFVVIIEKPDKWLKLFLFSIIIGTSGSILGFLKLYPEKYQSIIGVPIERER